MNDSFVGYVELGDTLVGSLLTENASRVPTDATGLPTGRVYGPSGYLLSLTCALLDDASTTGLYSWSIEATTANGFASGQSYSVLLSATVSGVVYGTLISFQVA